MGGGVVANHADKLAGANAAFKTTGQQANTLLNRGVMHSQQFLRGVADDHRQAYNALKSGTQTAAQRIQQSLTPGGQQLAMAGGGRMSPDLGVRKEDVMVRSSKGTVKTEKHHIATDKSKKFDFKNHPAFKETGINVSKDIDNLVDLANHRGRHTNKYHQEVQDRLDAVYNRYGSTDKLEGAVRAELRKMKQELLDGKLDPYGK